MNSEVIILLSTITTGLIALIGLCVRYAFLSKCVRIKCCCCEIQRDIQNEIVEMSNQQNNNIGVSFRNNNNNNV